MTEELCHKQWTSSSERINHLIVVSDSKHILLESTQRFYPFELYHVNILIFINKNTVKNARTYFDCVKQQVVEIHALRRTKIHVIFVCQQLQQVAVAHYIICNFSAFQRIDLIQQELGF